MAEATATASTDRQINAKEARDLERTATLEAAKALCFKIYRSRVMGIVRSQEHDPLVRSVVMVAPGEVEIAHANMALRGTRRNERDLIISLIKDMQGDLEKQNVAQPTDANALAIIALEQTIALIQQWRGKAAEDGVEDAREWLQREGKTSAYELAVEMRDGKVKVTDATNTGRDTGKDAAGDSGAEHDAGGNQETK